MTLRVPGPQGLIAVLAAAAALLSMPAQAGPAADALGICLADHTTGRERKDLARWMFVAMAAHPEIRDLSAAGDAAREQTSRVMARIFTRLLSEDCPKETRLAMNHEGSDAMQTAFGSLGKLAMQELMSNPEVAGSISAFERYVDRAKVEAAIAAP